MLHENFCILPWPQRSRISAIQVEIIFYSHCPDSISSVSFVRPKQPTLDLSVDRSKPVFELQLCALEVCRYFVSECDNTRTVAGSLSGGKPGANCTVWSSSARELRVVAEVHNLEYTGRDGFDWVLSAPEYGEGEPLWLAPFASLRLEDVAAGERIESEAQDISLGKWLVAE